MPSAVVNPARVVNVVVADDTFSVDLEDGTRI